MKITLIGVAVLAISTVAAPALAQDTESFTIRSDVPPFCSQLAISPTPMDPGNLTGASGQLVTAFAGGEVERELAVSFYCNAPSRVTITALPLMHTTVATVGDAASFTNRVDYTASLKWRDLRGAVSSTVAAGREIVADEAIIGAVTLSLSDPKVADNRRPIAGSYQGQVRLTIALAQ